MSVLQMTLTATRDPMAPDLRLARMNFRAVLPQQLPPPRPPHLPQPPPPPPPLPPPWQQPLHLAVLTMASLIRAMLSFPGRPILAIIRTMVLLRFLCPS